MVHYWADDELAVFGKDIIYGSEAHHILDNNPFDLGDLPSESCDSFEGGRIEYPLFIDDPYGHHVLVKGKEGLHLVIVDPDRRGGREHILLVCVCDNLRELDQKEERQDHNDGNDTLRSLDRYLGKSRCHKDSLRICEIITYTNFVMFGS